MSIAHRRTRLVQRAIEALTAEGHSAIRPGDVANHLRVSNQPLGVWEVRGEFSSLEAAGVIVLDPATGAWRLAATDARKAG